MRIVILQLAGRLPKAEQGRSLDALTRHAAWQVMELLLLREIALPRMADEALLLETWHDRRGRAPIGFLALEAVGMPPAGGGRGGGGLSPAAQAGATFGAWPFFWARAMSGVWGFIVFTDLLGLYWRQHHRG
jgi:hypothetical protein